MTIGELRDTFLGLIHRGLIEVMKEAGGAPVLLSDSELDATLRHSSGGRCDLAYGLTEEGGHQWELFAMPDWQSFIDTTFFRPVVGNVGDAAFVCADRHRLERYFRLANEALTNVDSSTARWDGVQPWQATYWKTLPTGYRVRFRCNPEPKQHDDALRMMCDMRAWYAWR